jgi:hypothetical protein
LREEYDTEGIVNDDTNQLKLSKQLSLSAWLRLAIEEDLGW